MNIELGYVRWKIYRWNEHPNPFLGRSDLALQWLRKFQGDRLVMSELRAKLTASGTDAQRLSDDSRVLQEVADRLSSGEFHVCAETSHRFHTPVPEVVPPDPTGDSAAEALKSPPVRPPAPPPPPEPEPQSTLSDTVDAAQMGQSLQQAAQTGAPFCEECQKAKQARLAKPQAAVLQPAPQPEPESTLPETADPAAIAASPQTAADQGAPFCEECEKARKEKQAHAQSVS